MDKREQHILNMIEEKTGNISVPEGLAPEQMAEKLAGKEQEKKKAQEAVSACRIGGGRYCSRIRDLPVRLHGPTGGCGDAGAGRHGQPYDCKRRQL